MNIVVAIIADWATLVATGIAIAGLAIVFLTRPRFEIEVQESPRDVVTVVFWQRGTSDARDVEFGWALKSRGGSKGDAGSPINPIRRNFSFRASAFRTGQLIFSSPPDPNTQGLVELPADVETAYLFLSYQSGLMPWRRAYLVYEISIDRDEFGQLILKATRIRRRPSDY